MDPNLNERFDLNDALAQVDAGLRGQSEATHKGALDRAAEEAEPSVTGIPVKPRCSRPPSMALVTPGRLLPSLRIGMIVPLQVLIDAGPPTFAW